MDVNGFKIISGCETDKEVSDILVATYEGTTQDKE